MYVANINFDEIPEIGFAHQHYSMNYGTKYGINKKMNVEIAYINLGAVRLSLYGKEMLAKKGSVIVIFRHLPIFTSTTKEEKNSHVAVLAEFSNYNFSLLKEDAFCLEGFLIPFVTEPCIDAEKIGKRLYKIAADMAENREKNALSSSVEFLSILKSLDEIYRKNTPSASRAYTSIKEKVFAFVEDNCEQNIGLCDIAKHIGKSQNHISFAFKKETGKTITQYINEEKIKKIIDILHRGEKSFKKACEKVSLCDATYGYKLFKKFTGLTPKEYFSIKKIDFEEREKK